MNVKSFSCHQCDSVRLEELSKKEAKNYRNNIDRCVDFDGTTKCVSNLKEGLCHMAEVEMKAKCNDTCDLCRFKESGEMQSYDIKYWDMQHNFYEIFQMINISLTAGESSMYIEGFGPNNTIDGNLTSYFDSKFVQEPFIVVHLGGTYTVISVFVVNRWGSEITRQSIISLDGAIISALWIPPSDGGVTGNQSFCGSINLQEGFTLDKQTYKVRCNKNPIATHIKLYRTDFNKLELSEIKVGVVDHENHCGYNIVEECDASLGSDQCAKAELSGIWHGKRVVYTQRRCHYPRQRNISNCTYMTKTLNGRWSYLKSPYSIEGAYDPDSFVLRTCDEYFCDGSLCNMAHKTNINVLYLAVVLILPIF